MQRIDYGKYPVSGYTFFDLYTAYKFKHVMLTFAVNNLFNADYYPVHSAVRGATSEGRYYIKGSGTNANLGAIINF